MTTTVPEWDLADRMRKALRESGFGAGDMADYLGVSRQTISKWLGGQVTPRGPALRLWAMRTGVPFAWLQGDELSRLDSNQQPSDYGTIALGLAA